VQKWFKLIYPIWKHVDSLKCQSSLALGKGWGREVTDMWTFCDSYLNATSPIVKRIVLISMTQLTGFYSCLFLSWNMFLWSSQERAYLGCKFIRFRILCILSQVIWCRIIVLCERLCQLFPIFRLHSEGSVCRWLFLILFIIVKKKNANV